jgi:hypothetical protein
MVVQGADADACPTRDLVERHVHATLGGLALATAALPNYAITLNAALQPAGVYSGTITIGGLIDRGDIYGAMQANPDLFSAITVATLNPDDLADTVWQLYTEQSEAEAVINAVAA